MSIEGIGLNPTYFPHQQRSTTDKFKDKKKFFKQCIDAGITLSNWEGSPAGTSGVRPTKKNKIINYNLYNDIVDRTEMERVVNPFKLKNATFPAAYRNYPLINPNIGVLLGEERKRLFNPIPIVINEDAITERLDKLNGKVTDFVVQALTADEFDEKKQEQKLQKIQEWATYTYKDKRERMAWQTLNYLIRTQDITEEFSRGFEDLLVSAEEIYVCDIYAGEPILRKGNPLNFTTLRSGDSYKIEDSDIIVEEVFMPIGKVIDRYYDELKESDIKKIEQGYQANVGAKMQMLNPQLTNQSINIDRFIESVGIGHVIEASNIDKQAFSGAYDEEGNVRVTRVVWRGRVKVGVLKYRDEDGILQKDIVSEFYEPDEELGEKVEHIWINEWYEGTRIGDDLYVKMGPREVQMRSMDNISVGHPGIVGTVFNINSSRGKSMMDFGKHWQYLWNIFMYRTELAFARAKGKIGKLPAHLVPDGWDMDKWMYYAEVLGWAVEDAFNEGQRGAATGKIAGSMNQSSPAIDLEMSDYIRNHLMMLDFIQNRADEITGITKQRKGAIENRETVGGVERAVMQSSHITEKWFGVHDNTKERALKAFLETAKVAWKGKSFKRDYVLDDGTKAILDFDSDIFIESDYGIDITGASSDMEMIQQLKGLSELYLQNQGSMSVVADLYRTKNPADLQRKIERHENNLREAEQEQYEREQENIQAQIQSKEADEQRKYELEIEKLNRDDINKQLDRETDILIAEIKALGFQQESTAEDTNSASEDAINHVKQRIEEKKLELEGKKLEVEKKKLNETSKENKK